MATEPVELDRAASFPTAVLRNTTDGIMAAWLARAGSLSSVRAAAWPTTGSTFDIVTQFETTNASSTLAAVEPNSEGGLAFLASGQVGTIAGLYAFSCAGDASRISPPSRSSLGTSVAYTPASRHGSLSPGVLLPITSNGSNLYRMGCGTP
jgi:hypothetical protein